MTPADNQPGQDPEGSGDILVTGTDDALRVVRRKVSGKGTGGVSVTVFVTVQQGRVWVSIDPPFTWEAIMGPKKVDELIRTLTQARDDAKRMGSVRKARL